ncbi:MAG: hypothetical protein ABSE62_04345 [Chthoniobacteraceae bacterium]|jgi:hypothetical protein
MKRLFRSAILVAAFALAPALSRADTDAEVAARASALDLAGAFSNDGFKLRDGYLAGTLKPGETALIQVNLYAGNQYWFSVAASDPKSIVAVNVYDETGKLVNSDPYANANRAAVGFAPDSSGPYYVRVANSGGAPETYCLIYSYK